MPRVLFLGHFLDVNICMSTELSVGDIASVKTLLEAACTRGAFRANEMTQVGRIYDKISLFLEHAAVQLQQGPTHTPQGDPDA